MRSPVGKPQKLKRHVQRQVPRHKRSRGNSDAQTFRDLLLIDFPRAAALIFHGRRQAADLSITTMKFPRERLKKRFTSRLGAIGHGVNFRHFLLDLRIAPLRWREYTQWFATALSSAGPHRSADSARPSALRKPSAAIRGALSWHSRHRGPSSISPRSPCWLSQSSHVLSH